MKTVLVLALTLVGLGCSGASAQEGEDPSRPSTSDDGGDPRPGPPGADGGSDGDGGADKDGGVLPDGGLEGGKLVWSADLTTRYNARIAATDTHVGVVSRSPMTVISADGLTKTDLLGGERNARAIRAAGSKLVVAGFEGSGASLRGMFTADVIGTAVSNEHVVPMAPADIDVPMIDTQKNIGVIRSGGAGLMLLRVAPSGADLGRASFPLQDSGEIVNVKTMGDGGALAAMGHYVPVVNVLAPGHAPFSYTMPNKYAQALAFGSDRLAIVTSSGVVRSTVHIVSLTGALLDAASLEGIAARAVIFVNDHEIIVAGQAVGAVNARRAVVRRYDFTKKADVWIYLEPETPGGVTTAGGLAIAPSGAVYAALCGELFDTIDRVIRLTP